MYEVIAYRFDIFRSERLDHNASDKAGAADHKDCHLVTNLQRAYIGVIGQGRPTAVKVFNQLRVVLQQKLSLRVKKDAKVSKSLY